MKTEYTAQELKLELKNQKSKLESKRNQLEQLLRKRERINNEILTLKRSIKKSSTKARKLTEAIGVGPRKESLEVVAEFANSSSDEEDENVLRDIIHQVQDLDATHESILNLLLEYESEI